MRQVTAALEAIRAGGATDDLPALQPGRGPADDAGPPAAGTDSPPEAQAAAALEPAARQAASSQYREERRWVTILSADLPGFATLAERLDPEDLKTLAHQCAERFSAE